MRTALIVVASLAVGVLCGFALAYIKYVPSSSTTRVKLDIEDGGVYRVRAVVDGDTVVLENGLHLRYNGMNAPESGRWVKDASPMSKEATAKNIALVEGKSVRLKLASDPIDMHGRIVANVFLLSDDPKQPEKELREIMLKQGFAKVMGLGVTGDEYKKLKSWQDEAKAAEVGIWGVGHDSPPAETTSAQESKPFCASSTGKTYHRSDCSFAKRITPANRHGYASADEAEAAGLKPCGSCLGKK